jgi:hypothetical protein
LLSSLFSRALQKEVVFQDGDMRFPLFELDLSGNRFSGRLTQRASHAGALGLRRLDVSRNPLLDQNAPFPPFLAPQVGS